MHFEQTTVTVLKRMIAHQRSQQGRKLLWHHQKLYYLLVDDQDEDVLGQNNAPIVLNNQTDISLQQPNEVRHRYPQRENKQRPLWY